MPKEDDQVEKKPHSSITPNPETEANLFEKVNEFALRVGRELSDTLPLLSSVRSSRIPGPIRDVADVDIAATRLGRMLQLLQGSRSLAQQSLGTAIAPISRAMWETWFDTAWMLHDPQERLERATAFWAAGVAQQLGIIRAFQKWDGYLVPVLQEAMEDISKLVKQEPHLYDRWLDDQARSKRSLHSIHWVEQKPTKGEKAKQMGQMYEKSYDIDYTLLSIAAHGEGGELPRLMEEGHGETHIHVGEGTEAAINYLLLGCVAAIALVYEIQHAYLGGHTKAIDALNEQANILRKECPAII